MKHLEKYWSSLESTVLGVWALEIWTAVLESATADFSTEINLKIRWKTYAGLSKLGIEGFPQLDKEQL